MLYQLPTGKTIEISFEQWLNMTDLDEQEFIARNLGEEINHPFFGSAVHNERNEGFDIPDVPELTDIKPEDLFTEEYLGNDDDQS